MNHPEASKPAPLWRNPFSVTGFSLAGVCTLIGLPLMFADMIWGFRHPYAGIFLYALLPGLSAFGIAVALGGLWWERRRRLRGAWVPYEFPRIDLNQPKHRYYLVGGMSGVIVLLVLLSMTGYQAYHYTDSVQFCGQVCHEVMKPEHTAYQDSPHARVTCVECHVGAGAGWYARSKLSGAYQLYSVAFNKFSRPIKTPVENLRPATETCAQCHWPQKFFGAQMKTFHYFMADEKNTPWQIQTLLQIGGGDPKAGVATGIHYHMNIKNEIYYVAEDKRREVIPWVKVVDDKGQVTEYMSTESSMKPEDIAKGEVRRMDCVDCHNRPTHIFHPPDRSVNLAMATGRLDNTLPYLKRESMRLLASEYKSEAEALQAIMKELPAFYEANYPSLAKEKGVAIRQAVEVVQDLFRKNIFPEMKTDWRAHPDHIGHLNSDGCFRCHDGLHKSRDGKAITNDCNACHTIIAQGAPKDLSRARLVSQAFKHPVDVGVDVSTMKCSACHSGTIGL